MLKQRTHHGITLSSIGLGTWAIGGPYWTDDEPTGWGGPLNNTESIKGIQLAIKNGITHIDVADAYGHGKSEQLVGSAIKGLSLEDINIASKVGFIASSSPSVYSPENIRFQAEQSLRNLGVKSLDIYYFHHCDFGSDDVFLQDAVEEINKLKSEGLIKSIGLSGYAAEDLIRVSKRLLPDFIQSWASIEHDEFIREGGELSNFMIENDIKFIAMMPFGQGRLLGKYSQDNVPTFEKGDNRNGNPEFGANSLAELQPKINLLKSRFGETPEDLITPALGFILKHPSVISVIPGFRNIEQVEQIIQAISKTFTDDDMNYIKEIFSNNRGGAHPWSE